MKAVILAGGQGRRMGRSARQPKPLMRVGDKPMLAHVMDIYLASDVTDFVICAGYRFEDFVKWMDDVGRRVSLDQQTTAPIYAVTARGRTSTVTLVDTGERTHSGGRLRRVRHLLNDKFFLTYADGLADVDLTELLRVHKENAASVTLTAFPLVLQYGIVDIDANRAVARGFQEKPVLETKWCNGGFYVVEPSIVSDLCTGDEVLWEAQVLSKIAAEGALGVLRHDGFWASMDFAHQHDELQTIWREHGPIWLSKGR